LAYDFKSMLRRKEVKAWLKSISAFANTGGGSLFYGVNDDGVIVGLNNPQADADFISEMIKTRLDPALEVQLSSIEHEGHILIEVKIKAGMLTSYYYYQEGTRTAYTRVGNESVECIHNNSFVGIKGYAHDVEFAACTSDVHRFKIEIYTKCRPCA
jgi:ATP-dependent DNA helicase RecG